MKGRQQILCTHQFSLRYSCQGSANVHCHIQYSTIDKHKGRWNAHAVHVSHLLKVPAGRGTDGKQRVCRKPDSLSAVVLFHSPLVFRADESCALGSSSTPVWVFHWGREPHMTSLQIVLIAGSASDWLHMWNHPVMIEALWPTEAWSYCIWQLSEKCVGMLNAYMDGGEYQGSFLHYLFTAEAFPAFY